MKNKYGIEICCKACKWGNRKPVLECETCYSGGFTPRREALYLLIETLEAHIKELSSRKICDKIDSLTLEAYETEFPRLKAERDKLMAFVEMVATDKVLKNYTTETNLYSEARELLERIS